MDYFRVQLFFVSVEKKSQFFILSITNFIFPGSNGERLRPRRKRRRRGDFFAVSNSSYHILEAFQSSLNSVY